jgi:anti-anti-sigma regulatory factor
MMTLNNKPRRNTQNEHKTLNAVILHLASVIVVDASALRALEELTSDYRQRDILVKMIID